jgi:tripartite-type tricarboxylate transporter receptor subunit TctC
MRAVLALAAVLAVASAAPARAQNWPQRQVTIVVPFAAGGSADLLARILQQHLQAQFGVPFVVENRSGAGGSIGTGYVERRPPTATPCWWARSAPSPSTPSSTPS